MSDQASDRASDRAPRRNRTFFAVVLLSALMIAGVASFYASSHPDGLLYVAGKAGFIDQKKASPAAKGPFAGYSTKGIENPRLSGGVAGVSGALMVLVIGGSLFWVLRRKGAASSDGPTDSPAGDPTGNPTGSPTDSPTGSPTDSRA